MSWTNFKNIFLSERRHMYCITLYIMCAWALSHTCLFVTPWTVAPRLFYGVFQARLLEKVAVSFSRESSQPRDWTCISCISYFGRWIPYPLSHWGNPTPFIENSETSKWIYDEREQISVCQGLWLVGVTMKWHEGTFLGDGNILCLNCGFDNIHVYICQNSLNFILRMGAFYYTYIIPQ